MKIWVVTRDNGSVLTQGDCEMSHAGNLIRAAMMRTPIAGFGLTEIAPDEMEIATAGQSIPEDLRTLVADLAAPASVAWVERLRAFPKAGLITA